MIDLDECNVPISVFFSIFVVYDIISVIDVNENKHTLYYILQKIRVKRLGSVKYK